MNYKYIIKYLNIYNNINIIRMLLEKYRCYINNVNNISNSFCLIYKKIKRSERNIFTKKETI